MELRFPQRLRRPSHIMFDGPKAWGICEPQREEVEERMWAAIQSWDINSMEKHQLQVRAVDTGSVLGQAALPEVGASSPELGLSN